MSYWGQPSPPPGQGQAPGRSLHLQQATLVSMVTSLKMWLGRTVPMGGVLHPGKLIATHRRLQQDLAEQVRHSGMA